MPSPNSSRSRNSQSPLFKEDDCDCSCNLLTWTFLVGCAQMVICSLMLLHLFNSRSWGCVDDSYIIRHQAKSSNFTYSDDGNLSLPSFSFEALEGGPVPKEIFSSVFDVVVFPFTALAYNSYKTFSMYETADLATERIQVYSVSGICLGILLIVGDFSKRPIFLGWWLILDGIRTLTFILQFIYRQVQERWCFRGFSSRNSYSEYKDIFLVFNVYFAYQIGSFVIVTTKRCQLRKRLVGL